MRRRLFAGLCALVIACPAAALADDVPPTEASTEARAQYQLGSQAFAEKKYEEAALHFEAAASFRPHAVALYTAGLAWDLAVKPERAADAYARALEISGLDAKQTATAKERVAALEKTLGTLVVTGREGSTVQLDASTEAPVPARLHGTAGVHPLSVRTPGKPIEQHDVTLETGKVTELDLTTAVPREPAASSGPAAGEAGAEAPGPGDAVAPVEQRGGFWTTRRAIGVGVGGLGVAALGAAVILGVNANGAKDAFDAAPTQAAYDHASALETWTNVAWIGGAVALAGGIALVLLPDDASSAGGRLRVGLRPGGASLGGTF